MYALMFIAGALALIGVEFLFVHVLSRLPVGFVDLGPLGWYCGEGERVGYHIITASGWEIEYRQRIGRMFRRVSKVKYPVLYRGER